MSDESAIRVVRVTSILLTAALGVGCLDHQAAPPAQPAGYPADSYNQPGQFPNAQPGYSNPAAPPTYAQPGYPQPGYAQPGYAQPGYPQQPNYQQPGYTAPPSYGPSAPGFPPTYDPQPAPPPAPAPAPTPATPPGQSPAPATPPPQASGGLPFPFPIPLPGGLPGGGGPQPRTPSTGAATPIDPNLASVATVPLMAYAQQEAPGMQREGVVIAGNFKEGQTLEQPFQMLPGKCYTVLAVGAGPQQLDLSVIAVTPIPQASPVLAEAHSSGPNVAVGGRNNCVKWNLPIGINAKYVLRAARGQGIIASQLYTR